VVEVLTFLCYCEVPMGHKLVLEGLDQVQEYWKESARFDAWMRILENTIDGRGRFGTMVGMSEDLKKAGTMDSHLIEYVVCICQPRTGFFNWRIKGKTMIDSHNAIYYFVFIAFQCRVHQRAASSGG